MSRARGHVWRPDEDHGDHVSATVSPGDTVAILLPNSVAWVQSRLASNRAGALAAPISYDPSLPEIG